MLTFNDSYIRAEQNADYLHEADQYRLIRQAYGEERKGQAHQRIQQLLNRVGHNLIETGERLQTRAGSAQG